MIDDYKAWWWHRRRHLCNLTAGALRAGLLVECKANPYVGELMGSGLHPHMAWSLNAAPVLWRIQIRPSLRWELFVERLFTLARNGHTDERGILDPALMIELLRKFPREIAPAP